MRGTKPFVFRMQFQGQATPMEESADLLRSATSAPSNRVTTTVGGGGVAAAWEEIPGQAAQLNSVATLLGDDRFIESGTLTYGDGGASLTFTTHEMGCIHPGPDGKLLIGAVIWRITEGRGQFAGCTGYITANFFYDPKSNQVTDNQTVVVYPAARKRRRSTGRRGAS